MEEKKERVRKEYSKDGKSQKHMGWRADFDVIEILKTVENKGRLINNLIREWARAKNKDERASDTDPRWNQIEDELK